MIYIYTLSDPLTNEVRYVGKTNNLKERYNNHLKCRSKDYKSNWIKSLKIKNLKPKLEILEEINTDDWIWLEQYWISQFKTWGFNLTNMTNGGDSNYKFTKEVLLKMSIQRTGRKQSLETIEKRISPVRRKINQYDLSGNYIKTWNSIVIVSKYYNVSTTSISQVLKGRNRKCKNFQFKYYIDNIDNINPIRLLKRPNRKKMKNKNDELYSYYLHFNPYTGYWNAVKRDKSVEYLNGTLGANDILKHKNIDDLIRFLSKPLEK